MSFSCGCCRTLGQVLFEYDTPRIVSIKSRKVGLINRLVQLGILAYVIGWVFVWQKGYQQFDSVISSVTTKVKGVAVTNTTDQGVKIWDVADYIIPPQKGYQQFDSVISSVTTKVKGIAVTNTTDQGVKIWDVADYIIPPQEETSFFVMTNVIMTLNQQQGRCPEMPEDSPHCISDSNCTAGMVCIQTGKCVPVNNSTAVHTCEVLAWCPLENDVDTSHHPALLKDAEQFTVLIKNNIRYPKFNFTKCQRTARTVSQTVTVLQENNRLEAMVFRLENAFLSTIAQLFTPVKYLLGVPWRMMSTSLSIQTGKCVPVNNSTAVHTCEVLAWCPLENDVDLSHHPALLKDAEQFTVLIKNNIRYPKFNFTKLGDIVREAGEDFQEIAVEGGVMGIQIKWDCDLDQSVSKCVPQYTFRRLDNKDVQNTVAPGYNFRFAKYYKGPGEVESRTLIKAYGIRFDVMVFGKAGKFDIIPTMINIGSGLALLGVATVLCDVIVLHILKKKTFYREKKYKYVEDYDLVGNSPACETP
ncbi:UNVERIFIED_CONTAM: hypothetical protein FKN15_020152 [Acipenser sinensis]